MSDPVDGSGEAVQDPDPVTGSPSLARQSMALLLGRGAGFVFSFFIPLVLVRVLEQATFGAYKQYFLLATSVVPILALGIPYSLYYFVPGGGETRGRYLGTTMILMLPAATLALVAGAVLGGPLTAWMNSPEIGRVAPLLGAYVALSLLTQFAEDLAVVEQRPLTAGIVTFLSEALRSAVLIGAATFTGTLAGIAWASVVYGALRFLFVAGFGIVVYGTTMFRASWETARTQLRYALPFGVAMILTTLATYLHQYFVSSVSSPAEFAIYAVGCFQVPMVYLLYAAVADPALVRATEHYKSGRFDAAADLYRNLLRLLQIGFIPGFAYVVLFAPDIVTVLFTADYLEAAPILAVFSGTFVLKGLGDHVVLRSFDETRFILWADLAGLIVQAGLLVPLYGALGLVGVVTAFIAGLAVTRLAGVVRAVRILGAPFGSVLPSRALALAVGLSVACGALAHLAAAASSTPLFRVAISFAVFGATYASAGWWLGLLRPEEKARLVRKVARLIGRQERTVPGDSS